MGINFPMISTPELARKASESLRYPPNGSRGFAPSLAAARWGVSGPEYVRAADSELLNVITIEDAQSVEQLDEILAVPGIDVAAIASFDLS
ncbi:MAG TPA: aldolase/citrate lyase family protein, partial [Paraburkholderia sp.]|uniref:aldolase/citrate lyase family protein n=1 Tax=Paraburkholderia sp. TaxID=1926495 RepID=UPI002B459FE8